MMVPVTIGGGAVRSLWKGGSYGSPPHDVTKARMSSSAAAIGASRSSLCKCIHAPLPRRGDVPTGRLIRRLADLPVIQPVGGEVRVRAAQDARLHDVVVIAEGRRRERIPRGRLGVAEVEGVPETVVPVAVVEVGVIEVREATAEPASRWQGILADAFEIHGAGRRAEGAVVGVPVGIIRDEHVIGQLHLAVDLIAATDGEYVRR